MTSNTLDAAVGRVLDGRYRVLSRLADGGMATVYLARDQRLDRDVAVKIMRPDLARDHAFVGRFQREARLAAGLSHPNIVAVHDFGTDGGDMFLVMEYVEGQTLRERISSRGAMTVRAALGVFDPILQGVDAAHRAGLIHRDIKPENVILGEDGTVKVADFGLARAVTSTTTTGESGVLLGTVAYLSPEQVERGVADARSDVYAAGLLLYEMLTGQKAFHGDTPIHVAYQHVHGSVPAPSERVATVPVGLDRVVARASARDPDERPRTAGDLLAEVRRSRSTMSAATLDAAPAVVAGVAPTTVVLPRPDPLPGHPENGTTATLPVGDPASAEGPADPATAGAAPSEPTTPLGTTHPRRRRRGPVLAAVLAVLLLAGGGWYWYDTWGPRSQRAVPQLAGLSRGDAERSLGALDLRATVDTAYDEVVPKDAVISAAPTSGSEVRKRSAVLLTVSLGPERYAVPTLVGAPRSEADGKLSERRLAVGNVDEAFSETAAAGVVISQDPAPDSLQKRDTPVNVVVSKGRQPIAVPNQEGKPADAAQTALEGLGLKVTRGEPVNSDTVPAGSVVGQTPNSGTLFKGDTVALVVSKGPVLVPVPGVTLKTPAEASAILQAAGFQVAVEKYFGGILNTVRFQNPAAGKQVPKGSTVTLTVW
ncbi:MAG: Stk1 family PASTA domain-containing Ser/Thr kinase [Dermatophilaceae bacterium]